MTAIVSGAFRHVLVAVLALTGTVATFSATTQPAHAAPQGYYTAQLATPTAAPQKAVIGETLWNCEGDTCAAARDTSRPVITCQRLVRKFGPVTRFATPAGDLAAEDLTRCNAH